MPNGHPAADAIQAAMTAAKQSPPAYREVPCFNPTQTYGGIRAITFDGLERNGCKTKVFAYYGVPALGGPLNELPAVVLLHGGGGHAYLQWVKMWNERGYAAIAFDNTGYFPTAVNAGCEEGNGDWAHGLSGVFAEKGYTDAPDNDHMSSSNEAIDEMWMYHAVGQTIIAHNILRADSRVDSGKIGVIGISWGGVIASITIGYDERFAFAVPIYGSGYLDESLGCIKPFFSSDDTKALWSAARLFSRVGIPVLWLCWNDDNSFSINVNSKSYLDTAKNNTDTRISIIHNMYHSHNAGWAPKETMQFADSVTMGAAKLTSLDNQPSGRNIDCRFTKDPAAGTVTATLFYITDKMTYSNHQKYGDAPSTYMDQVWKTSPLTVTGNRIAGEVPKDAAGYYIELKTGLGDDTYVTTSVFTALV